MTVPPLPSWAAPKTAGPPAPDSPLDRLYGAFVGPRWPVYRRKFAPFYEDGRFQPTWNWAAALATFLGGPFWFLYRKLYLPAVIFFFLPQVAFSVLWQGAQPTVGELLGDSPVARDVRVLLLGIQLSMFVLAGGTANFLLYRRAQAAIRFVRARGASEDQALPLLARVGRVNVIAVAIVVGFMLLSVVVTMSAGLPR